MAKLIPTLCFQMDLENMEVELRLREQHAMRELSARADSLAALEKRLDLSTPVRDSTCKTALQPPVEDVDLRRRPRDMDYRNVVSQSVATSSVGGTSFVGPRVTRTRKSVLPDAATISRVGPRETRTPQSTVTEPTSRSVKRKVQETEGTVAVPNSGKASVAAGPLNNEPLVAPFAVLFLQVGACI